MTALLAMVPPFALGWMVVRFLMPARRGFYAWMLDIALGIALGAGIASILEFVLTCAGVANRVTLLSAEVLALAGAGLVEFRRRPLVSVKPVPEKSAQKNGLVDLAVAARRSCGTGSFYAGLLGGD